MREEPLPAGTVPAWWRRFTLATVALGLFFALMIQPHSRFGANEPSSSSMGLGRETEVRLELFLQRFSALVPGMEISIGPDASELGPTGFSLLRYRVRSSKPELDESSALLLSQDEKSVFVGHAMVLPGEPVAVHSAASREQLSRFFSQKAGGTMRIDWDSAPGPGGAFPARISVSTPFGEIESCGALSGDGRWFLFGAFFPLSRDPRQVRMERLVPQGRIGLGPASAKVTLMEIADFQCPNCAELQPLLEGLLSKYPGKIRLVRVDFPQWQVHDWGFEAAEWCRCAGRLAPAAFWPLSRIIYRRQGSITAANLQDLLLPEIQALGLSRRAFDSCRLRGDARSGVLQDLKRVASAGLSGTPIVLVNGALLERDIEGQLEPTIAAALQERGPAAQPKKENK